jgi:hypothetical protein
VQLKNKLVKTNPIKQENKEFTPMINPFMSREPQEVTDSNLKEV